MTAAAAGRLDEPPGGPSGDPPDGRLSDLERDALAELGNIGIGKASTALGRMVGDLVRLSVPSVEVMEPEATARSLGAALPGPLIGVSESLGGVFDGTALFLFPEADSLPLVRAALPPDVPPDEAELLEEEALAELGNIVLNSALALVANILGGSIDTGLPVVRRGTADAILAACRGPGDAGRDAGPGAGREAAGREAREDGGAAVLFHIDLRATAQTLGGRVVLVLGSGSMERLKATLGGFIGRVSG